MIRAPQTTRPSTVQFTLVTTGRFVSGTIFKGSDRPRGWLAGAALGVLILAAYLVWGYVVVVVVVLRWWPPSVRLEDALQSSEGYKESSEVSFVP